MIYRIDIQIDYILGKYVAMDAQTFDPCSSNLMGEGDTEYEAAQDLLTKLQNRAADNHD